MNSDSSLAYAQIYCKNINKLIAGAKSEYAAFEILDTEIAIRDSRIKELEEFIRANPRCECFWHIDASTDPAAKKRHLCAKCALNV